MKVNGYLICPKADLSGANLSKANLSGADLREANLTWAHLSGANLNGANLRGANLREANLREANLSGANLNGANLSGAHLSGAHLSGANLREANLSGANLSGANLRGANLREANLSGANLSGAKNIPSMPWTIIVPEGQLIVWRKVSNGLAKLCIPPDAKRSNATTRKCRASFAVVLELTGKSKAFSIHDPEFEYKVGETVVCDKWDENRWNECSGGIHFFLTREEAEAY